MRVTKPQRYILEKLAQDQNGWRSPDRDSTRVLGNLLRKGMVYQNYGKWKLTPIGLAATAPEEERG